MAKLMTKITGTNVLTENQMLSLDIMSQLGTKLRGEVLRIAITPVAKAAQLTGAGTGLNFRPWRDSAW